MRLVLVMVLPLPSLLTLLWPNGVLELLLLLLVDASAVLAWRVLVWQGRNSGLSGADGLSLSG